MPQNTSVFARSILETKLKAMVFCRGIACFLGYPIRYDPTFSNHHLLGIFLEIVLSYTDTENLWDFNAVDLSTVFAPLLDYADLITEVQRGGKCSGSPLSCLGLNAIEWMQKKFTFKEASDLTEELDALANKSCGGGAVWVKWFEFVRYSELIHTKEHQLRDSTWYPWVRTRLIGVMMMRPMEPDMAEQQFFHACCKLHEYLPANEDYKERISEIFSSSFAHHYRALLKPTRVLMAAPTRTPTSAPTSVTSFPSFPSLPSLPKARYPTVGELSDAPTEDSRNTSSWSVSPNTSISFPDVFAQSSQRWALPAEFTPEMYTPVPISARMRELLEGSIPEPRDANWKNYRIR